VLIVIRRAGYHPYPNLSNHSWLVIGVFAVCGVLLGRWLAAVARQRGRAGSIVVAGLVGAPAGVAVAVMLWALGEGAVTGHETGMHLLNIPFLWLRGLIPFLTGLGLGWWVPAKRP